MFLNFYFPFLPLPLGVHLVAAGPAAALAVGGLPQSLAAYAAAVCCSLILLDQLLLLVAFINCCCCAACSRTQTTMKVNNTCVQKKQLCFLSLHHCLYVSTDRAHVNFAAVEVYRPWDNSVHVSDGAYAGELAGKLEIDTDTDWARE